MTERVQPTTADQVREAVAWAVAEGKPAEVVGAGTKRTIGRPANAEVTLSLAGYAGIDTYEPAELVLTARAGTPLAEIEAAVAAQSQQLAFEPPDLGPLLGGPANGGTLGGAVACNLSGPRRFKAGAARDHFLGFTAVNGRGESFKSGGHVVKNVTGYDLSKLLAGSYGTLAVMTEITLKVLPAPETVRTLRVHGLDDDRAIAALGDVARSPHEPTGLCHLPAAVSAAGGAVTAIRLEGPAPSVAYRAEAIRGLLAVPGEQTVLDGDESGQFWREIGNVTPFVADQSTAIWRLSVPPAAAAGAVRQVAETVSAAAFYDWAGGLIWLAVPPNAEAAAAVRAAADAAGGHATLVRADPDLRAQVEVFQPQSPALAGLTRRIKDGFDPKRVLNPGRMYAGV